MKQEYKKAETAIINFAQKYFHENIEPAIKKAMIKNGIKEIDDMNNRTFFTLANGTVLIDSEFNDKHEAFYEKYIAPLYDGNSALNCINIKIKL